MKEDIIKLINAFNGFLDDMYDRGAYDPRDPEDAKVEELIRGMADKYLPKDGVSA